MHAPQDNLANYPIYIVVSQRVMGGGELYNWGLPRIITHVFECTLGEYNRVYEQYIAPMYHSTSGLEVNIFSREPQNFLRNWKDVKKEIEKETEIINEERSFTEELKETWSSKKEYSEKDWE